MPFDPLLQALRFPPPAKLTLYDHHDRLDMTLAVTEAVSPNTPNPDMTLAVTEASSPNKPNLDMTLAAEAVSPNKPNLDDPGCCWGGKP